MTGSKTLVLFSLLALTACSAEISSDLGPLDFSDPRELKVTTDPLSGTVNAQSWKVGKAVAKLNRKGEYAVTLAGAGIGVSCTNTFPMAPHVAFVVPGVGAYPFNSSAGADQRVVNVIFPWSTTTGGGSDNVLASKSLIQIDSVQNGFVTGGVSALSPSGASNSYDFGGRFDAIICNDPTDMPVSIRRGSSSAFRVQYAEAVKTGGGYSVRLMDHIPQKKCNAWDSWMMTETPIKYLSVKVPAAVGAFTISKGILEFGDQGTGSGWSTDAFNGSGKVMSLSNSEIVLTLNAKDFASWGVDIEGAIRTAVCVP